MPIREIEVAALGDLVASGASAVRVIDVRELHEYLGGHVPGAELIPLASVPDNLDRFQADETTYVICRSGARSLRACEYVADYGYDVVNVAGGTMAWIASGREVTTGDQPT